MSTTIQSVLKVVVAATAVALTVAEIQAQELRTIIVDPDQGIHYANADDLSVRALPVRDNLWVIVGAGANIAVQTGDNGVLLVDSGSGRRNDDVLFLLQQLSTWPIGYIINTSYDPDHSGGNEVLAESGRADGGARGRGRGRGGGNTFIASHERVLGRLSAPTGETAPTPSEAWPTETYYAPYHDIYFNGEGIQLFHAPAATTDGDSLVFFRRSDVIATGDIFLTTTYPVIDLDAGGTIDGVIEGLNHILELAIPEEKQEGGTLVIPGHGRVSDEADVLEYRDMLTIIRDRVQDAMQREMTLEAILAAGLTRDYDPRYGTDTGPWTTGMFVEAVYRSLDE